MSCKGIEPELGCRK